MSSKPTVAVSIGDLNGVGFEIALRSHEEISKLVDPVYFISEELAKQSAQLLKIELPSDFRTYGEFKKFQIKPSKISKKSGKFSFESFRQACDFVDSKQAIGVVTMPVNKEAWKKAGVNFVGHTNYLKFRYKAEPIMMLGCEEMFVALYTDHLPLKEVVKTIKKEKIYNFLKAFAKDIKEKVAVLGINPHCGDGGVLGNEDIEVDKAIEKINKDLNAEQFVGPFVPDTAFTKVNREKYRYFVAMYHDQGLAPLKALYFEESINVSLNIPIKRSSVDHGTAFDIAYKDKKPSNLSYINAVKWICR